MQSSIAHIFIVKNHDNYIIEINPQTPEPIVDVIRYINKRIYGVFDENGSSCINKRLLDIYCKYLQLENITYSVIEDENKNEDEPPLKRQKAVVELVVCIKKTQNECIITTSKYDQHVIELIKESPAKHRRYNKLDKSWIINDKESYDKFIEKLKLNDIKFVILI